MDTVLTGAGVGGWMGVFPDRSQTGLQAGWRVFYFIASGYS